MPSSGAILSRLVRRMKAGDRDPLRPLIDAYLIERDRAPERHVTDVHDLTPRRRPPGRLSPSGLCGCMRASVFAFLGVAGRRRVDPDQELIFDDGNWRHLKWQATFEDMELVLGRHRFAVISIENQVLFPSLYVAGSLDVFVWIATRDGKGKRWVIDIKGINDVGFSFLIREDAPIPAHVKQLVAYCRSVRCPRGLLFYENKNNQQTKTFIVNAEEATWQEVESWCLATLSYMERQKLPPIPDDCVRGNYLYEKCRYSHHCYGGRLNPRELREMAYESFTSVDDLWRRGLELTDGRG